MWQLIIKGAARINYHRNWEGTIIIILAIVFISVCNIWKTKTGLHASVKIWKHARVELPMTYRGSFATVILVHSTTVQKFFKPQRGVKSFLFAKRPRNRNGNCFSSMQLTEVHLIFEQNGQWSTVQARIKRTTQTRFIRSKNAYARIFRLV